MAAALLLLALAAAPGAPPEAPRQVGLRAPVPGRLRARLEAQLVDVPAWRLAPDAAPAAATPPSLEAELRAAADRGLGALVAVAPTRPPAAPGLRVTLTDVAGQRRYVRTVAALDETGHGAATQSAVAVLLRDSLRALADAGALTWTVESARAPLRWSVGAFGAGHEDGLGLRPGVGLRGRLEGPGLTLTLDGTLGFARSRRLEGVAVELTRHAVRLSGGYAGAWGRWSAEAGLQGGLLVYRRRTVPSETAAPRPPRTTVAGTVGPYVEGGVRLGPIRVFARASGEALLGGPALTAAGPDGEVALGETRAVGFEAQLGASLPFE